MTAPLRIVVADAHELTRTALRQALDDVDGVTVVTERDLRGGLSDGVGDLDADIVLITAGIDPRAAIDACFALATRPPDVRVLVLAEDASPETLVAAVEAGIDGFVLGEVGIDGVVDALRSLARGEAVVPPAMLGALLRNLIEQRRRLATAQERLLDLTPREREVLELLGEGCDQIAIADILTISPETARTHIQNVLGKLEVGSRTEAAVFAVEAGLVRTSGRRGLVQRSTA